MKPCLLAHFAHYMQPKNTSSRPENRTNELDTFMNISEDIQGHILGFFPLMTSSLMRQYQTIAEEADVKAQNSSNQQVTKPRP